MCLVNLWVVEVVEVMRMRKSTRARGRTKTVELRMGRKILWVGCKCLKILMMMMNWLLECKCWKILRLILLVVCKLWNYR